MFVAFGRRDLPRLCRTRWFSQIKAARKAEECSRDSRPEWFTEYLPQGPRLPVTIGDAPTREIIRRHLDADPITDQDAYAVLAHFAGNCGQHDVRAVVELNFEECIGLLIDDRALCWN